MQQTKNKYKFNRQSDDDKSDEIFYKTFDSGLAFKYIYNSLEPFISAYRPLINKRALICDLETIYPEKFGRMFVYFWRKKYLLLISTFGNLKL
jgi:hypothetical protein